MFSTFYVSQTGTGIGNGNGHGNGIGIGTLRGTEAGTGAPEQMPGISAINLQKPISAFG